MVIIWFIAGRVPPSICDFKNNIMKYLEFFLLASSIYFGITLFTKVLSDYFRLKRGEPVKDDLALLTILFSISLALYITI